MSLTRMHSHVKFDRIFVEFFIMLVWVLWHTIERYNMASTCSQIYLNWEKKHFIALIVEAFPLPIIVQPSICR